MRSCFIQMFAGGNHLERNGTSNETTHKKDNISVYNIISVQNITLEIPTITKNSTSGQMLVGKYFIQSYTLYYSHGIAYEI